MRLCEFDDWGESCGMRATSVVHGKSSTGLYCGVHGRWRADRIAAVEKMAFELGWKTVSLAELGSPDRLMQFPSGSLLTT